MCDWYFLFVVTGLPSKLQVIRRITQSFACKVISITLLKQLSGFLLLILNKFIYHQ